MRAHIKNRITVMITYTINVKLTITFEEELIKNTYGHKHKKTEFRNLANSLL